MARKRRTTEPLVEGLGFGEGPRWHDGRLWYSDFHHRTVSSMDPGGATRIELEPPDQPSGLGWLPDGRLLVVAMKDRAVLRREPDGVLARHAELGPWAGGDANDMVVSASGQAYVGNFGFETGVGAEPRATSLVRIDPDGTVTQAADGLWFPNGAVLTPDGRTLIIAESMADRLSTFDLAPDGSLANRRVWAELPEAPRPDGICLDAEGRIWVASAGVATCTLVERGGNVVDQVATTQPCYACMLGGPDRRTLYCVTAPGFGPEEAGHDGGRIEQIHVEVAGAGLP